MGNKESKTPSVTDAKKLIDEDWLNQRITRYFEDTEKHILDVRLTKEERNELGDCVEAMLDALFKEVEHTDKRFRVKKSAIVKFGSFYEGTEIISPAKLQFYFVIDDFSGQNIIGIEKVLAVEEKNHDLVKVYVKENIPDEWEDCMIQEIPKKQRIQCEPGLVTLFYELVHKAVGNLREKHRDRVYAKYGRLELCEENAVRRLGSLVELKFAWNKELIVSVDITPVVKCDTWGDHVVRNLTFSDKIYEAVKSNGTVILVPEAGTQEYFRRSFAHSEVQIMKEIVSQSHRRVYKFLKYLVQGYNPDILAEVHIFHEDALKTLLIRHDQMCKKADEVADCTISIITQMQTLLKSTGHGNVLFLPSIYNNQQNVLKHKIAHAHVRTVDLNQAGLDCIVNHLNKELGCAVFYEFDKLAKELLPLSEFFLREDYWAKKVGATECLKMRQRKFEAIPPISHNLDF